VIGSVGQPRDGNPAACYGAIEAERNVLVYVRVPTTSKQPHAKFNKLACLQFWGFVFLRACNRNASGFLSKLAFSSGRGE
jgi:hypothetical protein